MVQTPRKISRQPSGQHAPSSSSGVSHGWARRNPSLQRVCAPPPVEAIAPSGGRAGGHKNKKGYFILLLRQIYL
eukprot:scaffold42852_cov29-Tisochrysis_lutea.AAC.2